MKVKCIDNLFVEQELTEGKVYDVLGEETNGFGEFCRILCDSNREDYYLKERFEPVQEKEEEIPVGNITKIALEIAKLVEKKNHDYNNSFAKTLAEYGDTAYFLRIEDKLSRLKSLSKKDAQVVEESIEDTLKDIVGYTLLMLNEKVKR